MPIVFITGGGGTIGPGIVEEFGKAGYDMAINYNRSKEKAEAAAKKAETEYGVKTLLVKGSIASVDDIRRMFAEVKARFGGIDVMVNNAGITRMFPLLEASEEQFDEVISTDLKGTYFCIQEAARNMVEYGIRGTIINISSNHAIVTWRNCNVYSASKAAIDRLTKSSALDLSPYGIRVVAIAPGYTGPDNVNDADEGWGKNPWYKEVIDSIPIHRYCTASEVGRAAVFLSSESAGYITGTVLTMDGGANVPTPIVG